MKSTGLILTALALLAAAPAFAQVQARVGDTVRLDTSTGVFDGRIVEADAAALVVATRDAGRKTIIAEAVDRVLVRRPIPGSGRGAQMALIFGGALVAVGAITEPDPVPDRAVIDVNERGEHWLGFVLALPVTMVVGFLVGNAMHDSEWIDAGLPEAVAGRHDDLRRELANARAALAPARPIGVSWSRSF